MVDDLIKNLENLKGLKKICFKFNESILINAMEKGEWVLLEDIHYAPQEIERLMSLLEENPTLTIYENSPILFFSKQQISKDNNKDQRKNIQIHENFRIIITSSNETIISSAVKSRCLCIRIKPFKENKDYSILLLNSLVDKSEMNEKNILELSKSIGKAFSEIKKDEKEFNYILKNYKLSLNNLVIFSKLMNANQNNKFQLLSNYIKLSIFSAFNKNEKKNQIKMFVDKLLSVKDDFELEIRHFINKNHKYYLSQYEMNIISNFYDKNKNDENIIKSINNRIEEKLKKEKYHLRKPPNLLKLLRGNININYLSEEERKSLIKNLESFTLQEMKEYESDINEVAIILEEFFKPNDDLYQCYYFIKCLHGLIGKLIKIDNEKLPNLTINKLESIFNVNNNRMYERCIIWFKNIIKNFDDIIPFKINILNLEKFYLKQFYNYYSKVNPEDKNKWINIHFKMIENNSLKKILKHIDISFNKEYKKKEIYTSLITYDDKNNNKFHVHYDKKGIEIEINQKKLDLENDTNIEELQKLLKENQKEDNQFHYLDKIDDYRNIHSTYYYPEDFYDNKNILKIFWFYQVFLKLFYSVEDKEISQILPKELYSLNKNFGQIIKKKDEIWEIMKPNLIKGYKLLEGLRKINERESYNKVLEFTNGIDLFSEGKEEANINNALIYLKTIQKFINENNDKKDFQEFSNKINILEQRKRFFTDQKSMKKYEEQLEKIKENYYKLENLEYYKFLEDYFDLIKKEIEKLNNEDDEDKKKKIKEKLENLRNELQNFVQKLINSQKINKVKENSIQSEIMIWKNIKQISESINLLFDYSRLNSIIEKIEIIKENSLFLNEISLFSKIIKKEVLFNKKFGKKIFKQCESNKNVEEYIIKLLKKLSNSYLICKIVKNNLQDIFFEEINNILNCNEKVQELINFSNESFIYLPNLSIDDIEFCFQIGESIGELNEFEENKHFTFSKNVSKEIFFNNLLNINEDDFNDDDKFEEKKEKAIENINKIKILFENFEKIKYNNYISKFNWLNYNKEEFQKTCQENPQQLIIKNKFGNLLNFKDEFNKYINDKKIIAKAIFATYVIKKNKPETKFKDTPFEVIFQNIKLNKNYEFGYRIMELYNLSIFRDNYSHTMINIFETIISILRSIFIEIKKESGTYSIIFNLFEELIIETISNKTPSFSNLKIVNIIKYLLSNYIKRFKLVFNQKKEEKIKEIENEKIKLIKIIKDIVIPSQKRLDEEQKIFDDRLNEFNRKIKNGYEISKKNYEISINREVTDSEFKTTKEFRNFETKYYSNKPINEDWKIEKDQLTEAFNNIMKIESIDDFDKFEDIITNNKIESNEINQINYSDYNNYLLINENLIQSIKDFRELNEINTKLNLENINEPKIILDNIKENEDDLIILKNWIININKYNYELFEVKKFDNIDITLEDINSIDKREIEKLIKRDFNFIFCKNNEPTFLYKNMEINLGVLILDCEIKNIGSIIIHNNFSKSFSLKIQQKSNYIYVDKENQNINGMEDIKIDFNINLKNDQKKEAELVKSEFEIILFHNYKQCDKCTIIIYIFISPLILKFSFNNEKYYFDEDFKKVVFHHYTNNLKIKYSFPGGICPKSLGILTKIRKNMNDIKVDNEEIGCMKIVAKEKINNYKFILSLKFPILNVEMNCQKPEYPDLVIFDEQNINFEKIKICSDKEKKIYIFNMTNSKKILNFSYDKNKIELWKNFDEIESGELKEISIKNLGIISDTILKINEYEINIEELKIPNIIQNGENYKFELDEKEMQKQKNEFKVYIIDKKFNKANKEIDQSIPKYYTIYLIHKNELVLYKENFKYTNEQPQEGKIFYGFNNKNEFTNKDYKDLIIIVGIYNNNDNDNEIMTVFNNEQRKFKKEIENYLMDLESNNIKEIFKVINKLIKKNNIDENNFENAVRDLELIDNDKISIPNILIYLIKHYSLDENIKYKLNSYIQDMYENKEIKEFFIPNKDLYSKYKQFLLNISYIISFICICLSPAELLPYEYNVKLSLDNNKEKLEEEYKICFKNSESKDICNQDIIYYNQKICKHQDNDEFDKADKSFKEIKFDNISIQQEQELTEFKNISLDRINRIKDNISKNEISISNLLDFLFDCKIYINEVPVILANETDKTILTKILNGVQLIYNYINYLKGSSIYKTKFENIISQFSEEIEYFVLQFPFFKVINSQIKKKEFHEFIKKCEIPFNDEKNTELEDIEIEQINSELQDFWEEEDNNIVYTKAKDDNIDFEKAINIKNLTAYPKEKFNESTEKNKKEKKTTDSYTIFSEEISQSMKKNYNPKKLKKMKMLNDNQNDFTVQKDVNINEIIKEDNGNISATKILEHYLNIIKSENQKYSLIRDVKNIKDIIIPFNDSLEKEKYKPNSSFISTSFRLQNICSNLIREKILNYDENNINIKTLEKSYIDFAIDVNQIMTEDQRIAVLIIVTGLVIPLSKYGCRIRISCFAERNCIWALSKEFSKENIVEQLSRLRDILSKIKRFESFPADALKKLKESFTNKSYQGKYLQILLSNLISVQVLDHKLDWIQLGQRIIVFGIKSFFEDRILNKFPNIYEELLTIPTSEKNQIIQNFFSIEEIIANSKEFLEKCTKPISIIVEDLLEDNIQNNNNEIKEASIHEQILIKQKYYNKSNQILEFIKNNQIESKYFSQNISIQSCKLSKFSLKNNIKSTQFSQEKELKELNSISLRKYPDKNIDEEFILLCRELTNKFFKKYLIDNLATSKIPCSSGGTISIQGLKRFICSGFTNLNIFEKLGGNKKKNYSLTYIIDLSESSLLECNINHILSTIILLLVAPSTLEYNEKIVIDVIINTKNGIKIIDYNSRCSIFKNNSKIEEIIYIIKNELDTSCNPGSCLNTAYQLLLEKRISKKLFFITDGFITNKFEIELALSLISKLENEAIDLIAIGVGLYPKSINLIFPECCFSPSLKCLQDSLISCIESLFDFSEKDIKQVLLENSYNDFQKLKDKIKEEPIDSDLIKKIEESPANILNMIVNEDFIGNEIIKIDKEIINPNAEPYYDSFEGHNILVIILYLGNYEYIDNEGKTQIADKYTTPETFNELTGKDLKKKGFKYNMVYSYGDAINELTRDEDGHCPYSEAWVFCSKGDGTLPNCVQNQEEEKNKIIPFLETVSEYNRRGGSLLLFCDNYPFVLETNLLLSKYLKFKETPNGSANFKMVGFYNNKNLNVSERIIKCKEGNENMELEVGRFSNKVVLENRPGDAGRLSLRVGITFFNEGITLSYAESIKGVDKNNNLIKDYCPFTPFACLSDKTDPRPFVLFYDPKIEVNQPYSRGPIVVHGGSTSAFYDYKEEGTGRLIRSIACWLVRPEELLLNKFKNRKKTIPIIPKPNYNVEKFNGWIKGYSNKTMYSIIILDVSGSMNSYYQELIDMTNKIIEGQMKNSNNQGTVIFFGNSAKAVIQNKYHFLKYDDIKNASVGGGTNFFNAFDEARKYIDQGKNFDEKRVLFLTDGEDNRYSDIKDICENMKTSGYKLHIIGFQNSGTIEGMKSYASENCFVTKNAFKEVEEYFEQALQS